MSNPLTGDFEAVLQVSGRTVNRLLASMHQNDGAKPSLPSFPHGVWMRIGDPVPIHGMRGNVLAQISVPRIELVHAVSDRFWLEVSIRARYTSDPGSVPIPEFINGTIRAQYKIENIDADCAGWEKLAPDYLWIRAIGNTVSFTGTAVDDVDLMSIAGAASAIDPAVADERITQLARSLLTKQFEATPHKVSRRFRRGSMRSLNVGINNSAVAVPIALSGDVSGGNIASVTQEVLEGKDVAIAINRDVIIAKIQEQLDEIKSSFSMTYGIRHRTYVDLGFLGDVDVLEVNIDWTIKLVAASVQWLGPMSPIGGFGLPGGLISISISGQARTKKAIFNLDFDVTQLMLITFDAGTESFSAVAFGSAAVNLTGAFAPVAASRVTPRIQQEIANVLKNYAGAMTGELSLKTRKDDLANQLKTMDDSASVWFDQASFTPDGVVVRGHIGLSARRPPVQSFSMTPAKDGYSAYSSWIPGGRIDAFNWSWKWFNNANKPGSDKKIDRFILNRPASGSQGRFGVQLGLDRPLPGLDGMGQVCMTLSGVYVHPVSGDLVPVNVTRKCSRFGFDVRVPGVDRVFLTEWVPGPRDLIGPVAQVALHEVSTEQSGGHGANTLVVRIGDHWNREVSATLREGLSHSRRRDAGLVVLVLFGDGKLARAEGEWLRESHHLASEIEAQLVVNEDVRGSWSKALNMETREGDDAQVEWRLLTPTGGVTWAHSGSLEARDLAGALDDFLCNSPPANVQYTRGVPVGAKISPTAFYSDVVGRLADLEAACPPPPWGRLGVNSKLTFVTKDSIASEAALRQLTEDAARGERDHEMTVVFEGAKPEEIEELRASLPEGVTPVADPDGDISRKFGVASWPTSVMINERGQIAGFDSGIEMDHQAGDQ